MPEIVVARWVGDTLAAIDAATSSCAQCNQPRGASPSDDFCSEACQRMWLSALTVDLPDVFDDSDCVHLEITVDLSSLHDALARVRDYAHRAQYARLPSLPPQELQRFLRGPS